MSIADVEAKVCTLVKPQCAEVLWA